MAVTIVLGAAAPAIEQSCPAPGSCVETDTVDSGQGQFVCPHNVTLTDSLSIGGFSTSCQFNCGLYKYDSTFYPNPFNCTEAVIFGAGTTATAQAAQQGTFNSTDCNWHYVTLETIIVSAQDTRTVYYSPAFGLKGAYDSTGNACP